MLHKRNPIRVFLIKLVIPLRVKNNKNHRSEEDDPIEQILNSDGESQMSTDEFNAVEDFEDEMDESYLDDYNEESTPMNSARNGSDNDRASYRKKNTNYTTQTERNLLDATGKSIKNRFRKSNR